MIYLILAASIIINILSYTTSANTTLLCLGLIVVIMLYKGSKAKKLSNIFNCDKVLVGVKNKENIIELLISLLISNSTGGIGTIIDSPMWLVIFTVLLFGIVYYRFFFANIHEYFK